MARRTRISWAEATWNVWDGCEKITAGCANCYAEHIVRRRTGRGLPWTRENMRQAPDQIIRTYPERLAAPRKWAPSRIFVESMSDFFLPEVPDGVRQQMIDVMRDTPQHRYLILTKRPSHARRFAFPDNVWLGVSVENRSTLYRLDLLREAEASVKWVSFEPLLEDVGAVNLDGIDWVVVGGESGPHFRPMDHAWARNLRDQARAAGIAFYFKQSAGIRPEQGTALQDAHGGACVVREYPDDRPLQLSLF
jgi:protein gp37